MNLVPAIGATALGIAIGWLVRYFIRRFDKFGPKVVGSAISIILGGAAIKFLEADKSVWWFYPIGLLLGFAIYQIIAIVHTSGVTGQAGNTSKSSLPKEIEKKWKPSDIIALIALVVSVLSAIGSITNWYINYRATIRPNLIAIPVSPKELTIERGMNSKSGETVFYIRIFISVYIMNMSQRPIMINQLSFDEDVPEREKQAREALSENLRSGIRVSHKQLFVTVGPLMRTKLNAEVPFVFADLNKQKLLEVFGIGRINLTQPLSREDGVRLANIIGDRKFRIMILTTDGYKFKTGYYCIRKRRSDCEEVVAEGEVFY